MARVSKYKDNSDEVLSLIAESAFRHGKAPTVRALADHAEVGVATMHSYLIKLAEEGMIEWQPKHHRSLRATPQGIQRLQSLGKL